MNRRNWFGVFLAGCVSLSSGVWAEDGAKQPVQFKSGEVSFTILKSDGETPVDGAKIKVERSEKPKAPASAVADKDGRAVLGLAAGKYLLNVEGRNISEMNVVDDATITECRVVLDDDKAGLLVTGGAVAVGTAVAVGSGTFTTLVVGGVAVMVAAGGGYAIYDNNKDEDDPEPVTPPVPTPPTPTPTPGPRIRPSQL